MAYFKIDVRTGSILFQINIMIRFWREGVPGTDMTCLKQRWCPQQCYNNTIQYNRNNNWSTPNPSVLYEYKTFDYNTYIFRELTQ